MKNKSFSFIFWERLLYLRKLYRKIFDATEYRRNTFSLSVTALSQYFNIDLRGGIFVARMRSYGLFFFPNASLQYFYIRKNRHAF